MKNEFIEGGGGENHFSVSMLCFWTDASGFARIVNVDILVLHDELESKS